MEKLVNSGVFEALQSNALGAPTPSAIMRTLIEREARVMGDKSPRNTDKAKKQKKAKKAAVAAKEAPKK
jgi:hypothetical protein